MFRYSIFKTALGYVGLVVSPKGIHMVILPRKSEAEVKVEMGKHYTEDLVRDEEGLSSLRRKFVDYFSGKKVIFKEKLDVIGATPFELRVWDVVYGIPHGETRSYDWVAKQVGSPKKVRAVGQALKHNRLPIVIPCHRVICKSGDLGGFSGGVDLKRKLLRLEGRIW
jgi:methylated-DNA-[protein]-cysteine S-methyltransferase